MLIKQTKFTISKILQGVISKFTTLNWIVLEPSQITVSFYLCQMYQTIVTSWSTCVTEDDIFLTILHSVNSRHLNVDIFDICIALHIFFPSCSAIFTCCNLQISCQSTHKEFEVSIIQLNNGWLRILSTWIIHSWRVNCLVTYRTVIIDRFTSVPSFTMVIWINDAWRLGST